MEEDFFRVQDPGVKEDFFGVQDPQCSEDFFRVEDPGVEEDLEFKIPELKIREWKKIHTELKIPSEFRRGMRHKDRSRRSVS